MRETRNGIYEQLWNPREYFRQYYSTPSIAEDERVNFDFLIAELSHLGEDLLVPLKWVADRRCTTSCPSFRIAPTSTSPITCPKTCTR